MSENQKLSLKRKSILKLKSEIQDLFANAERKDYQFFICLGHYSENVPKGKCKVFISVPKRCLAKATERNTVKRRIREAVRLNFQSLNTLCINNNIQLFYGIVWNRNFICEYVKIEENIILSLRDIYNDIYEKLQNP
ncbi:MAG TPA: ribonuclease P protein component [Bacteroidales bacterium]|nr:ribonuclease P protein component [Bacteroidales bacterium]